MADIALPAGGGGGQVILRVHGKPNAQIKAVSEDKKIERSGTANENGILQLKLPRLGLYTVTTTVEREESTQEAKVYRYGITEISSLFNLPLELCTLDEITIAIKEKYYKQWQVGDCTAPIRHESLGDIVFQIVGIDKDTDQYGKIIPLTLISKDCLPSHTFINGHTPNSVSAADTHGDGTTFASIAADILQGFPDDLTKMMKTKTVSPEVKWGYKIWIPSKTELDAGGYAYFLDNNSRIKNLSDSPVQWLTRTVTSNGNAYDYEWYNWCVTSDGKFTTILEKYAVTPKAQPFPIGICLSTPDE